MSAASYTGCQAGSAVYSIPRTMSLTFVRSTPDSWTLSIVKVKAWVAGRPTRPFRGWGGWLWPRIPAFESATPLDSGTDNAVDSLAAFTCIDPVPGPGPANNTNALEMVRLVSLAGRPIAARSISSETEGIAGSRIAAIASGLWTPEDSARYF